MDGMFPMLAFDPGIWYKVNFVFQQLMGFSAAVLLVLYTFRSDAKQRKQVMVVTAALFIPIISSIIYLLGWIPAHLDSGPFAITLTALISAYAVFKLGLIDLVPAAREIALDSIRDGFLVLDQNNRLQDINQAALCLPDGGDFKLGEKLPPGNCIREHIQPLLDHETENVQFSTDDGKSFFARAYPILNQLPRQQGIAILISDITETASLMNRLKQQANYDDLTGIYNRRQLLQKGKVAMQNLCNSNLPLGIILIDLDHFKLVNDQFGHAAGDEVLRDVTVCFRSAIRNVDILGRYGGEEFVIFLPGIDMAATAQIAQRLASQVDMLKITYEGNDLSISASFGVHAVYPDEHTSMDDILRETDQALYQAKRNGRNQVALFSEVQ